MQQVQKKKYCAALITAACVAIALLPGASQAADVWTWMSGADMVEQPGTYGTKGIPHSGNVPGSRTDSASWTDSAGNLWLFGGAGYDSSGAVGGSMWLNDLWRYNPANGQWTWISGSNVRDQNGIYGTLGTPSTTGMPGARYGSMSWTDIAGNLWLFGGYGYDSAGNTGQLNDLWRYNPASNQWTWMSGSDREGQYGTYGTRGVPLADNMPGARHNSAAWTDSSGNLWLFGGYGTLAYHNDLWRYSPSSGLWTWISGSNAGNQAGTYGTRGLPDADTVPGSRSDSICWTDRAGNMWLFGGWGYDCSGYAPNGRLNDLWCYNPATNQWTWMSGSDTGSQAGTYLSKGTPSAAAVPGARWGSVSWTDSSGNLCLFGGVGSDGSGTGGNLNDLWRYDVGTGLWTWLSGSDTSDQFGIYGSKGTPSAATVPGARQSSISWKDRFGNLWLFGGSGQSAAANGYLNDLWRYAAGSVTPTPNPPCAAAYLLGEDDPRLDVLRRFRDEKLATTQTGSRLIDIYYAGSGTVIDLCEKNPGLQKFFKSALERSLAVLEIMP